VLCSGLTIPTVLTRRSLPPLSVVRCTKTILSQKLSALKPNGAMGDEHTIVKRKTLSKKECRNELLGTVANIAVFPRIWTCSFVNLSFFKICGLIVFELVLIKKSL